MTDEQLAEIARGHLKGLSDCLGILGEREYSVRLIEVTHQGKRNTIPFTFSEIDIVKTETTRI